MASLASLAPCMEQHSKHSDGWLAYTCRNHSDCRPAWLPWSRLTPALSTHAAACGPAPRPRGHPSQLSRIRPATRSNSAGQRAGPLSHEHNPGRLCFTHLALDLPLRALELGLPGARHALLGPLVLLCRGARAGRRLQTGVAFRRRAAARLARRACAMVVPTAGRSRQARLALTSWSDQHSAEGVKAQACQATLSHQEAAADGGGAPPVRHRRQPALLPRQAAHPAGRTW